MRLKKVDSEQTASSSERNQMIYDFLHMHPVGVLASADPNGDPHGAVIYASVAENFDITFTTKRDTKKHENLQFNPRVMIVIFEEHSQTTVRITGVAEQVKDEKEATKIFRSTLKAAIETSESGVPPVSKIYAGPYIAYRVQPSEIRMAVFIRPERGELEEMYEIIEFSR